MAGRGSFRDGLVARLKYLIELRGKSVAQVEKELGRSRGFLGDALRGGKRLPIETILDVLALLQVDPARFFSGDTPDERRWSGYGGERSAGAEVADGASGESPRGGPEALAADATDLQEVARTLRVLVRLLNEKGYLSREELSSALASADGPGRRS